METKVKETTNLCSCKGKAPVRVYCQKCKAYLCEDCQVVKHLDHEQDIIDLAEKSTRFLAEYQKLSRAISLIADRRQVHIKDQSIDKIVEEIKSKLVKVGENCKKDIGKTTETTLKYIGTSPLIQGMALKKAELCMEADGPMLKLKGDIAKICSDLLHSISENKFESADRIISENKLQDYDEEVKKATDASANDNEFIQEVRKLKQTSVDYSYNPMALLGMIKVDSQIKKPNRIIQFDREKNVLNIFNIDTRKLTSTNLSIGFILPFRFVTVEINGSVYLCGGDNDHGVFLKSFYFYDELRGCLLPFCDMKEPRSRHALVGFEDKKQIFCIGGESANGPLSSCEYYDIQENLWKELPALIHARMWSFSLFIRRKNYISLRS